MCDIHGSLGKAFGKKGLGEMCASNCALGDESGVTESSDDGIVAPPIYRYTELEKESTSCSRYRDRRF
jgi:hypothetical protein